MISLEGKKLKEKISLTLKENILKISNQTKPKLAIIQIGDDSVSNIYIRQKMLFAEKIGALTELIKLPEEFSTEQIIAEIDKKNIDSNIHGIILQLPIPRHLDKLKILNCIKPEKDIDGLGAINIHKLVNGGFGIVPATARGIISLLQEYQIEIAGKNIVVVGRSLLAGKTISLSLLNQNATVTVCHSKTKNLSDYTQNADILISAVGKPGIINDEMVNQSQIIIDVGITKDSDGTVKGDVFLEKMKVAGLSPVPGGVGQMTVASLFQNLFESFQKQSYT